jgi:hypothetical protein
MVSKLGCDSAAIARLAIEPRPDVRVAGEVIGQHLDRHLAPELRVACAIHLAHATCAEWFENLVLSERHAAAKAHGGVVCVV